MRSTGRYSLKNSNLLAGVLAAVGKALSISCIALLSACGDQSVAPRLAARLEHVSGDDQGGFAGVVLDERIAVRVLDHRHNPVANAVVTWTVGEGGGSVSPHRSRTDANGIARASWMPGLTPGSNVVRASVGNARPIRFVASTSPLPETCSGPPLDLPLGGALVFRPSQMSELCLASSMLFTRDFVLVAFNTTRRDESDATIGVSGTAITSASTPPTPSISPEQPAYFRNATAVDQRNERFHQRLRDLERVELGPRVRSRFASDINPPGSSAPAFALSNPSVGESVSLNANALNACALPQMRAGVVRAVSRRAIIVADELNPEGGFTDAEYQSIAITFDTLVYPTAVDNFGQTTDLDGNDRIILFFSGAVNALTPPAAAGGFVAGFFFARDLFPRTSNGQLSACDASNESEVVYLMVPDPEGTINGNQRDKEFVQQRVLSTAAHELQHLINSSGRLYLNGGTYPERPWLDEALAHAAEELLFFRTSGLAPDQNVTFIDIEASERRLNAFTNYQMENVARLGFFLNDPNDNWLFRGTQPDISTRGAATWFLRYAADRLEIPERDIWRKLAAGPDTGMRNIEGVIEADAMQWLRDWAVSLYVDDAVHDLLPRYQVPSWHLRSVMIGANQGEPYPVRTIALFPLGRKEAELKPGGVVYFRFGLAPSIPGELQIDSDGEDAGNISLVLIRTR